MSASPYRHSAGTAKLNVHDPKAFLRGVLTYAAEHQITCINELPAHLQATHVNSLAGNDAIVKP